MYPTIPVAAAVIRNSQGHYLIGKRAEGKWHPGQWCFIGGKAESNETLQDALFREVTEEIRVPVVVFEEIHEQLVQYEHGLFHLHYFDCFLDNTYEPKPNRDEISEIVIVPPKDLTDYDLLPVDIDVARRIKHEAFCQEKNELLKRRQGHITHLEKLCAELQERVYALTMKG